MFSFFVNKNPQRKKCVTDIDKHGWLFPLFLMFKFFVDYLDFNFL